MKFLQVRENEQTFEIPLYSESDHSHPKSIIIADDFTKADFFYQKASEGAGFIWQGDFQNAKQLLQAVQRRIDKKNIKQLPQINMKELFHKHRQTQSHKSQLLSRLLIKIEDDLSIRLPRSPDVKLVLQQAINEDFLSLKKSFFISLRELLGMIGAYEWRKNGVQIKELNNKIYPYYGIFSPIRGEYLSLVDQVELPQKIQTAFDIGTGTGVLASILAKRGVPHIVATDTNSRAIQCALHNIKNLGYSTQIQVLNQNMFPNSTADLIVCNPPWIPAKPTSTLERAVYDPENTMLNDFIKNAHSHLNENGQAWLIISNLAELLGLRETGYIERLISNHQLKIVKIHQTKPIHQKSQKSNDLIASVRTQEVTQLWQLQKLIS